MALLASYNVKVTIRPPANAKAGDLDPEPLAIETIIDAFEEAIRRVYWDNEMVGGQSIEVRVTAERTDK